MPSKREIIFEPPILGIGAFFMYLCSAGVLLSLAVLGKCQWRGSCGAPLTEFSLIMLSHWCIVGFIIKRNLPLARWLLIGFGVIPFLTSLYLSFVSEWYATYSSVISGYLFIFGVLFTAYIWLSSEVKTYAEYAAQKRQSND